MGGGEGTDAAGLTLSAMVAKRGCPSEMVFQ